jgi:hypothetical protein
MIKSTAVLALVFFLGFFVAALISSTRNAKTRRAYFRARESVDLLLLTSSELIRDVVNVFVEIDRPFSERFKFKFIEYQSLIHAIKVRIGHEARHD